MKSPDDIRRAIAYLESGGDFKVLRRVPELPQSPLPMQDGIIKVVIIDTETTGLSVEVDKLIEVGAIARMFNPATGAFVGGVQVRSWLEDPGFALEAHTVALTGLTDVDLQGKQFPEAEIAQFLQGAGMLIAHSAQHDRPFLEARFPSLNEHAWGCSQSQIDWTLAGAGSSKLEFLAFVTGAFYTAHRALPDCHSLLHVLENFKLPDGQTAMARLFHVASQSSVRIHATGARFEAKDLLKERGYRWDGEDKVWFCTVDEDSMADEMDWLHHDVYAGRPARVKVSFISPAARFSRSPPDGSVHTEMRSIGAQGERPAASSGRSGRFGGQGRY